MVINKVIIYDYQDLLSLVTIKYEWYRITFLYLKQKK